MPTVDLVGQCLRCKQHFIRSELGDCAYCSSCREANIAAWTGKETVNHPPHYGGDTPYETVKVLAAWMTPEQLSGFLRGNAIKYLSRAGKKSDELEDLRKAAWYVNAEITRLEKPCPKSD